MCKTSTFLSDIFPTLSTGKHFLVRLLTFSRQGLVRIYLKNCVCTASVLGVSILRPSFVRRLQGRSVGCTRKQCNTCMMHQTARGCWWSFSEGWGFVVMLFGRQCLLSCRLCEFMSLLSLVLAIGSEYGSGVCVFRCCRRRRPVVCPSCCFFGCGLLLLPVGWLFALALPGYYCSCSKHLELEKNHILLSKVRLLLRTKEKPRITI